MESVYSIPQIRNIVSRYAGQYGAERVFLFGSYARGDMTPNSDIDLRIDKGDIRGLQFAGLMCDLEDAFGKHVDLISTRGIDEQFLRSIKNDEVLLYERS